MKSELSWSIQLSTLAEHVQECINSVHSRRQTQCLLGFPLSLSLILTFSYRSFVHSQHTSHLRSHTPQRQALAPSVLRHDSVGFLRIITAAIQARTGINDSSVPNGRHIAVLFCCSRFVLRKWSCQLLNLFLSTQT